MSKMGVVKNVSYITTKNPKKKFLSFAIPR